MLEAMRRGAKTKVMKAILAVLALTFVVFFGTDFGGGGRSGDAASPVEVGSRNISINEVSREFNQQVQRASQIIGQRIDTQRALDAGLLDQAVATLVSRALFDLAAKDIGVTASEDATAKAIRQLPAFQNAEGRFDRALFEGYLGNIGASEGQFVGQARGDLVRSQFLDSLRQGAVAPQPILDLLLRYRTERRIAEVLTVDAAKLPAPGQPDAAELAAFYEQNKEAFRAPERRDATMARLTPAALAADMRISEDDLREAYETRIDRYTTPETRAVVQGNFLDRESAQKAADMVAAGKPVAAAIEEVSGLPPVDLGTVARDDIAVPALADSVFAAPLNGIAGPVESPLGWHLAQITAITPASTKPFESVLKDLNAELAAGRARDEIFEVLNAVDDGLAGGAALDDVARDNALMLTDIAGLDRRGTQRDGAALQQDLPVAQIVAAVFGTAEGKISDVVETADGGFFVVRVDKVTPSAVQPLADIRAAAVAAWQDGERRKAAEAKASELAEKLRAGVAAKDLADSAAGIGYLRSVPFDRTGRDSKVSPTLVAAVFKGQAGEIVQAPVNEGFGVARIAEIVAVPDDADKAREKLRAEIATTMRDEIVLQFGGALEQRFTVDINREALERAFAPQ